MKNRAFLHLRSAIPLPAFSPQGRLEPKSHSEKREGKERAAIPCRTEKSNYVKNKPSQVKSRQDKFKSMEIRYTSSSFGEPSGEVSLSVTTYSALSPPRPSVRDRFSAW